MTAKNLLVLSAIVLTAWPLSAAAQEEEGDPKVRVERRIVTSDGDVHVIVDRDDHHDSDPGGWAVAPQLAGSNMVIHGGPGKYLELLGPRRFIGVELTRLTPELRAHFGVSEDSGIMVSRVREGAPAETAGVQVGDIITAIEGRPVGSTAEVTGAIRATDEGDSVSVEIWRDGRPLTLDVRVEERNPQRLVEIKGPDGLDRKVIVLPEMELEDFHFSSDGNVTGAWRGTLELDGVKDVLEHLNQYFSSKDWSERLEHIEEMDFETVEERMKKVEERLRELEKELESTQ